ncbi:hypothetical protein N7486_007919 [Penicillium sp. IBT 16267x]|nr:hypothetical protein N7486_007919 [Penicillium sp. IBT 16267x]
MSDDIESNIYCLKTEQYPFNIEQTSEAPTAAVNVNAEEPPRKKRTRRSRSDPEPEYSEQVRENHKRKMQKSDRSPHACDRCKIKRTRCTVGPEGSLACLPCLQLGLECFVTERVTNETFKRGEPGRMKCQIAELEEKVTELEGKVTGLEAAIEASIPNDAELLAKVARLEEENAALLTENLRWRDGMRLFSNPCVGDYWGDVIHSCDQLGSKCEEPF